MGSAYEANVLAMLWGHCFVLLKLRLLYGSLVLCFCFLKGTACRNGRAHSTPSVLTWVTWLVARWSAELQVACSIPTTFRGIQQHWGGKHRSDTLTSQEIFNHGRRHPASRFRCRLADAQAGTIIPSPTLRCHSQPYSLLHVNPQPNNQSTSGQKLPVHCSVFSLGFYYFFFISVSGK